jgi:hypothetical protein
MASSPVLPPNRHVEFKKGGWGAALLTTAVAIAAFLTAFYIHSQTYRHPTDVMMTTFPHNDAAHGAPSAEGAASGAGHGGEHGAAATPAAPGAAAPAGGAPAAKPAGGH